MHRVLGCVIKQFFSVVDVFVICLGGDVVHYFRDGSGKVHSDGRAGCLAALIHVLDADAKDES